MSEIADFGTVILIVAAALALAMLSTKASARVSVPAPAVFLVAAAVASDVWPRLSRALPIHTVERIAVVALVIILFNGGMDVGYRSFRTAAAPILALGVLGTFATAGVLALVAHYALKLVWMQSGIVAAALSPTDPAVMFSVLGGREIEGRSRAILEGEAGVNDPAGIALMIGMIDLARHANGSLVIVAREFALEMGIGLVAGIVGAWAIVALLRRMRLPSKELEPVFALALAAALYGATSAMHGSGFLAVFMAGLWLADRPVPHLLEIERFHGSLAGLAELTVFVALGLTVHLGALGERTILQGIALAATLALLARPLAAAATLVGSRLSRGERLFITWSGLKGAVPILLAAFALLARVDGAQHLYGIVFIVVLCSVVVQGTLVPTAARLASIDRP